METRLYDNIVTVIEPYLGPATRRFVDRQIISHLDKPPNEVTQADMDHLTEWISVSMSLLTDDRRSIDECVQKLVQLTLAA